MLWRPYADHRSRKTRRDGSYRVRCSGSGSTHHNHRKFFSRIFAKIMRLKTI